MQIRLSKNQTPADLTVLPLFANQQIRQKDIPVSVGTDFKKNLGETQLVYGNAGRILLLGLGEQKNFDFGSMRAAIHGALTSVQALGVESINLILPNFRGNPEQFLELTGFALTFSLYTFDWYRKDRQKSKLNLINVCAPNISIKLTRALERGIIIGRSANSARDLANHPGNIATPDHLAKHARAAAEKYKFSCKVLGPAEIKKEKMGLMLGVAKGSDEPSRFIILEYLPAGRQMGKKSAPVVLVGKGLTFDSGGISIKPADRMEEMKYDMCGAADVIGIFEAAAQLKLPVHLVGLIPSAENLVSGQATKPGDILMSHEGSSVEVINTDAEGRMVLADAISFAKKYYQPKLIIDYATLTGAIVVALGDQYTGYFSNTKIYDGAFSKAQKITNEKFWPMPLAKEYEDQMKSMFADIKNVGEKGSAGATTAALFLEHFVGTTPWIHLDIAGTAWTMRPKSYAQAGATAWGVYLTIDFLRNL